MNKGAKQWKKVWDLIEYYYASPDERRVKLEMGAILSDLVAGGKPIWLMETAPSSSGKSYGLAPYRYIEEEKVKMMDSISAASFMSNYAGKKDNSETSIFTSAVRQIVLIFSEATILFDTKNPDFNKINGYMKQLFHGSLVIATGVGRNSWDGKCSVICAATENIHTQLERARAGGERFTYYKGNSPDQAELNKKVEQNSFFIEADYHKEIGIAMKEFALGFWEFMAEAKREAKYNISDEFRRRVLFAAEFCVNAKATVSTDFKTGMPDDLPDKAGSARDLGMFFMILFAKSSLDGYINNDKTFPITNWHIETVEYCAWSSVNRLNRRILTILCEKGEWLKTAVIGSRKGLGLTKEMTEKALIKMHATGMIRKRVGEKGQSATWAIENKEVRDFVNRISKFSKEDGNLADDPDFMDLENDFPDFSNPENQSSGSIVDNIVIKKEIKELVDEGGLTLEELNERF